MSHKISIRENIDVTIPSVTKVSLQESAKTTEGLPEKITTLVEAIHSGLTRNFTFYPADNLERSVESWTRPYNKPVIKNHDIYEEPLGRVKSAAFKPSNVAPDKHTIELELEITDAETIRKIMDGRYQTLSIGGNASSAVCSVCAKDLVKEGYCGHQKGRTYEGKQAYWIIGEMDFDEISWVNVPADRSAQVIQKNVVRATEAATGKGGNEMPDDLEAGGILEQIDQLAGATLQEQENPEAGAAIPQGTSTAVAEEADPEADPKDPEADPADPAPEEPTVEEKLATIADELEEAQGRITALATENTGLVAERDTLQETVNALNSDKIVLEQKVADLEAELTVANEESAGAVKQNIQLASYTHKVLAESVANLELVLGDVAEADYSTKLEELSKESSRSLKEKAKELAAKTPQRIIQTVQNPLHGEDGKLIAEAAGGQDEKPFTIADYAEKINRAFNKTQYTN